MNNTLNIKNVTKKYGNLLALNDASICFSTGIYGLLGHNGAGKSTLLKIIAGTLKYNSGQILYNGKDIWQMKEGYRAYLGYMPQQQILDNQYTVESFLYYIAALKGIQKPTEKIEEYLTWLNLKHLRKKRINSLSGGMKQRVLIAQALLNEPKILLLDEPTAGLDPVERRNFRKIISDIAQDKIVIIATHVMSDIEFIAQRILLMKDGVLLTNATQEELLQKTKVFITQKDEQTLLQTDETIQLVNKTYVNGVQQIRFISKKDYPDQVPATMDDVYLDWLG